jgi:L-lysine 2,3-aminomutase
VTDVLMTGGDPLIMNVEQLTRYIEPLLSSSLETVRIIRIGTKALSYWPQRFVSDRDADDILRLFERIIGSGKQLAIMAHFSHPRELTPRIAQEAVQRIRQTGATIRCQAPLIRHINDSAKIWADLWRDCLDLGIIPYYMFVERDTGPKHYFEVPLARAYQIFRDASAQCSGLAHTVRGPTMSATPGKVVVSGVAMIGEEQVFILKFLRARNPAWAGASFFARFDPEATWLTDLRPALGKERFFFEEEVNSPWQQPER